MSPRSGTPVKLLGREDASVDWYNLEKSKRVKAFRCGEFDACIEKAEASLGIPMKKREKYARREDAILHALELERKQLETKQQKQAIISNGNISKPLGTLKGDFNNLLSSDAFTTNDESWIHGKYAFRKSPTFPRKGGLLHEEENLSDSTNIDDGTNNKQMRREEHISEAIPRMRGLQDFGLRIASKKKLPHSVAWLTARTPAECNMDAFHIAGHIVGGVGQESCSKNTVAKRKQTHCGMTEESLFKKRDRRRPLLQVLQSSAKLQASYSSQLDHYPHVDPMQGEKDHMGVVRRANRSRCIYLPADSVDSQDDGGYSSEETQTTADQFGMDNCFNEPVSLAEDCTSSGMIEANESDSSLRDYLETEMEGDILADMGRSLATGPKDCDSSACHVSEKFGEINNDEVPFSGYISELHPYEYSADTSAKVGVSKWHMRGKRNIRNLVKKPVDVMDVKISVTGSDKCDGSVREAAYGAKCSSLKMVEMEPSSQRTSQRGSYHIKKEDNYASDEDDLIGEDFFREPMNRFHDQRYPLVSKAARDLGRGHIGFNDWESDSHLMLTSDWEADGPPYGVQRKYWEESDWCHDPVYAAHVGREMGSALFDVNVNVKASYQGEHVPLVSLMSRLNGKAIVGHPVQIEILDDSTGHYFSSNYACPDKSTAHQPVWRTARRTAMQRVPRSNPVRSSLEDYEAAGSWYSERENKPPPNMHSGHSKNKSRSAKKKLSHTHRAPSGKFQKKSQKRISLSSQKTRTLSSFANEQRLGGQHGVARLGRGSDISSGLMKPGRQVPLVTCVPLKVAFSRILEAVGRPSSTVMHIRMANPAIRGPS